MAKKINYNKLLSDVAQKQCDLRVERKANVSIRSIAKEMGISASTMSRFMIGSKTDVDTLIAILDWLDKKLEDYLVTQ